MSGVKFEVQHPLFIVARALAISVAVQLPISSLLVAAAEPQSAGPVVELGDLTPFAESVEILRPMGLEVASDGTVLVADFGAKAVYKLAPTGELLWSVGRTGQGPGEFQLLYRASAGPDGRVAVLDYGTQTVSWFSAEGDYEYRVSLSQRFAGIDNMVALGNDGVALSGVARDAPTQGSMSLIGKAS